ncbi:MAG: cadherin-like domain-containing protein [Gammaproteobacteria bacterium]
MKTRRPRQAGRAGVHSEELEKRVLFSADVPWADQFVALTDAPADALHNEQQQRVVAPRHADGDQKSYVVAVDASAIQWSKSQGSDLLMALSETGLDVTLLERTGEAFAQLSDLIGARSNIGNVHLFTTASSSGLALGTAHADTTYLLNRATEISQWRAQFDQDADFALHVAGAGQFSDFAHVGELIGTLTGASVSTGDSIAPDVASLSLLRLPADGALGSDGGVASVNAEQPIEPDALNTEKEPVDRDSARLYNAGQITITVTNTTDTVNGDTSSLTNLIASQGGDGISLREAILALNEPTNGAGPHVIEFNISGAGPHTIAVASALPGIENPVIIDGTSEPDFAGTPMIVIDGVAAGVGARGIDLQAGSSGSTVRGLVIHRFDGTQIATFTGSDGNTIAGNYLGVDATGTTATVHTGTTVFIQSDGNIIGSSDAADRNVIAGGANGIVVSGGNTNQISGNYIGSDASGNTSLGLSLDGIRLENGASGNTIGGATSDAGNVVVGTGSEAIQIDGPGSDNNTVQHNLIGVSADGLTALGVGDDGIYITGTVDGTNILDNIIGNPGLAGIQLIGAISNTVIQGNIIGTDVTLAQNWGSDFSGIRLASGAFNTTIGGTGAGEGNVIANSGASSPTSDGIGLDATAGTGNTIRGNSIYNSANLGIDLNADDLSGNDAGDTDGNANNTQNYAVLNSAGVNGSGNLAFEIDTTTLASGGGTYTIDFYASTDLEDGNVEGRRYLGSISGIANGNATLNGAIGSTTLQSGEYVTLTTTDSNGNTSEFSNNVVAYAEPAYDLRPTSANGGGLALNTNGGNDSYLIADDGDDVLGGLGQLSFEVQFSSQDQGQIVLASYAGAATSNEFFVAIETNGDLAFAIAGNDTVTLATNFDFNALRDGQTHTLGLTWDNGAGNWTVYVDGVARDSGTGHNASQSLEANGTLVFGQEQDTVEGQFDPSQVFSGTLYNVRFFSDLRTAAEMAASFASALPYNEAGLVAQWRFDTLSSNGVVIDDVAGNNLTIKHVTEDGFAQDSPALSLNVSEAAVTGTIIGTVTATDDDRQALIDSLLAADPALVYSAELDQFYRRSNGFADFSTSQSNATAFTLNGVNGQLATIRSALEQQIVVSTAGGAIAYIGASDAAVEGEFRWLDGTDEADLFWLGDDAGYAPNNAYSNWLGGRPDGGTAQSSITIGANGLWDDQFGNTSYRSIIQWDGDAVLDATQPLIYSIEAETVDGAFAIDSDSGDIRVLDGSLLNFDTNDVHTLTIRTVDGDGNSYEKDITIRVNAVGESNGTPTGINTGIELNADGGNDAYLITTDAQTLLGGLDSVTVEIAFQTTATNEQSLFSYDTDLQTNALLISLTPSGEISARVNDVSHTFSTTPLSADLRDGQLHHVAVSWDSETGMLTAYVDGEFLESVAGIQTSATLSSDPDSAIVLGQEQDGVDTGYDSTVRFSGTLYDVRIWDNVREAADIGLNYQHRLDLTPAQAAALGLVANWQMTGFDGSGDAVDIVSGNNLSVSHAAGAGFVASTPRDDLHIAENAVDGDTVGFVVPGDPDVSNDIVEGGLFLNASGSNVGSVSAFGDWTVTAGSVDSTGFERGPLGGRAIDMNGSGSAGSLSQTLQTVVGQQYQIVFALSGNWEGGDATKDLRVSAAGTSVDFHISEPTGWSSSNMLWENRTLTFTATDTTTDLTFASLEVALSHGAMITDVQVIEVPAAVTAILNNDTTLSYDAATGKFYRLVTAAEEFDTAVSNATTATLNGISGQLVTIRGDYENEIVRGFADTADSDVWLGATDRSFEGVFYWLDGSTDADIFWTGGDSGSATAGHYANFQGSGPDDFGGAQDEVALLNSNGQWDDRGAGTTNAYVIEWDAQEVLASYTYSLTDNAGGRFVIDTATGEIRVADAALLDHETAAMHDVIVQVTDAAGAAYSQSATIVIDNGVEAAQSLPGLGSSAALNAHTPVIHLRLGEGSGATAFDSARNNDGTYNGVVLDSSGAIVGDSDTAVTFNGAEYVEVAHSPDFDLDEGTIQLWFNTDEITQTGTLFSKDVNNFADGGHITARYFPNGEIEVRLQSDSASFTVRTNASTQPISDNEWHHFAFSFGDDGMRLYIDGQLLDTDGYTGGLFTSSGGSGNEEALIIGASNLTSTPGTTNSLNEFFEGQIDEFAILDQQLSDAEVLRLANASSLGVSATEDTPLVFSVANGNAITVDDTVASANTLLRVSLSVTNGTLSLSQLTNLTIIDGANHSDYLIVDGTESDLNAALEGMTFTPGANFNGNVSVSMTTAVAADLIAHYTFDDGTANDQNASTDYDGSFFGNATVVADMDRGNVLTLDGDGDYVQIDGLFGEPQNVTLAAWINTDSVDSLGGGVISLGGEPALYLNSAGQMEAYYNSGAAHFITDSDSVLGTGWRHVAMTVDTLSDVMTLYIDGVAVGTVTAPDSIEYVPASTTYIGRDGRGTSDWDFNGQIDDARVFDRALTADEIAAIAGNRDTASDTIVVSVAAVNDAPSFEFPGQTVLTEAQTGHGQGNDIAVLADGSMLVIAYDSTGTLALARLNADGSLDTSFGTSGFAASAPFIQTLAVQANGQIVVGGADSGDIMIARYNADGSLDTDFGTGGTTTLATGTSDEATDIAIAADGSIVVVGNYGSDSFVARFDTDGVLDSSFDGDGIALINLGVGGETLESVALQSDGMIVAGGTNHVVRVDTNGSLDLLFDGDGILDTGHTVEAVIVLADGSIAATGESADALVISRYDANGVPDTDFGVAGVATWSHSEDAIGTDLVQQADGRIVVSGNTTDYPTDWVAVRFNLDGTLDTTFGDSGAWVMDQSTDLSESFALALYDDGNTQRIVIGGYTTNLVNSASHSVVRLNNNGTPDTTLATNTLDGNPTYVEGDAAVILDDDVQIFDQELSGTDDFGGTALVLQRNGGSNTDDQFSATGDLVFNAGTLELNFADVGNYANANGQLILTFATGVSTDQVNAVMRAIAYSNTSDSPPASVQIDWTFGDGNAGAQGSGGSALVTGSTVVNITDVDEPATLTVPIAQSVDEDTPLTFSVIGGNAIVLESGSLNDPMVTVTLSVTNGSLTLLTTAGITFVDGTNNGNATITLLGTESAINAALDGMQFQGDQDYNGSDTLTVTTGSSTAVETDLYARYEFFGGATTDDTGNGFDGTLIGDPTLTSDAERGDVLTFDGDDRISIVNGTAGLGNTVTISAWVNLDAGQEEAVFLSIGDEFYVTLDRDFAAYSIGVTANNFSTNNLNSTNNIAGEGWNHVAATFNQTTKELYLYLNGVLVTSSTFNFTDVDWATADSQNITIGSLSDGTDSFAGSLDDIRIYTSELSRSQIVAVMGDHGFDSETVAITVDAVNDAPVFTTLPPTTEAIIDNAVAGASVITSVDVDGDGDLDIIGATENGQIYWYANDGDGGFSAATSIFNTAGYEFASIATGDLDGDGDLDFVVSNNTPDNSEDGILVFDNQFVETGTVSFTMTSMESTAFGAFDVAIADIDGDTRLDIVASFNTTGEIRAYEQNVAGVFTPSVVGALSGAKGIDVADLDGDGSLDIVAAGSGAVQWFENDSTTNPGFTSRVAAAMTDVVDVAVGDFNGVAGPDIGYIRGFFSTRIGWLENDGNATPGFIDQDLGSLGNFSVPTDLIAADIDGGGSTDLVVSLSGSNSVRVYDNNGSGTFTQTSQPLSPGSPQSIAAADLDGDGDLELLYALPGDSAFAAQFNRGAGVFSTVNANEDTTLNGLQVQIDDVDAQSNDLSVTLTVANGIVTIPTGAVTFAGGANSGSSVTLTGTVAQINTALNSFTFTPNADYHGDAQIDIAVNDQGNTGSGGVAVSNESILIHVRSENDAPVVTVSVTDVNFTEQSPVGIDVNATITDIDDTTLTGAIIRISANYEIGVDQLQFTNQNGISGTYDNGSGILTLSGLASVADYQTALRSIVFANTSDTPSTATRTIEWTVNDGDLNSASVTRDITVATVADAPVIANLSSDTLIYAEGAGAVVIDQMTDAAVSDADSVDFDTGTLTVSFATGSDSAEDILGIANIGTGAGQIGISGLSVTYGGVAIGTFAGGASGTDLVITLNANADAVATSALIRAITYQNNDTDSPTIGDRTVRFILTDGDGGTSSNYDTTVSVTSDNDAPVLGNNSLTISEGATVILDSMNVSATDVDDANGTLQFTVSSVTNGQFELVANAGVAITSFTQAQITAGAVQFVHSGGETAPTYSVSVSDGGLTDGPEAATITFTNINDAPVIGNNSLTISEGGTVVLDSSDLSATDAETAAGSLQFTVSSVTNGQFELVANAGVAITSFTQAQITAGAVQFVHSGGETSPTYSVSVSDGSLTDGPEAATITFTNVNDAPVIGNNSLTISEGGTVVLDGSNLSALDAETAAGSLQFAVSSVTNGQFELVANAGVAITSFTQAQIASGAIQFVHDGTENAPTYSVSVSDGSLTDGPEAATITFTNVNDAPVIAYNSLTITEGGAIVLDGSNLSATDAETAAGSLTFDVSGIVNGQFELVANAGVAITSFSQAQVASGAIQFVHDGTENAPAYNVTVSDGALAIGPDAATVSFIGVNNSPVIANNSLTVNEGETVVLDASDLSATDSDSATGSLQFTASDITGGQFELTAAPGAAITTFTQAQVIAGDVQFVHFGGEVAPAYRVSVSDGNLSAGPQSANISFSNLNDAPIIANNALTISEGGSVILDSANLSATDTDSNTDSLAFVVNDVTNGQFELVANPGAAITTFTQLQLVSGEIRFVHFGSESAPTYSVTISDGDRSRGPDAAAIVFVPVNDAPVLLTNSLSIIQGQTIIIGASNLSAGDADSALASLTFNVSDVHGGQFELVSNPGLAVTTFTQTQIENGVVQFIHDGSVEAPAYQVTVSDAAATSAAQAASIAFSAANTAPTIVVNQTPVVTENQTAVLHVNGSDIDGDALTYLIAGGDDSSSFSIDAQSGALSFITAPDFEAPTDANADRLYDVDVAVDDGRGGQTQSTLQVRVVNDNESPSLDDATFTLNVADAVSLIAQLPASDQDADDQLTYSIIESQSSSAFAIDPGTGALRSVSDQLPDGVYDIQVQVSDAAGVSVTASVKISIWSNQSASQASSIKPAERDNTTSATPTGERPDTVTTSGSESDAEASTPGTISDAALAGFSGLPDLGIDLASTPILISDAAGEQANDRSANAQTDRPALTAGYAAELAVTLEQLVLEFNVGQIEDIAQAFSKLTVNIPPDLAMALERMVSDDRAGSTELDLRVTGAVVGSVSLSAGFVIWVLRAGSLMGSLLASRPLWSSIDPLPIFWADDDDDHHLPS